MEQYTITFSPCTTVPPSGSGWYHNTHTQEIITNWTKYKKYLRENILESSLTDTFKIDFFFKANVLTSHSRWSTGITLSVSQKAIPGLHSRALELAHLNVMNVVIKVINYNYGGPTMSKSLSQNWSVGFSPLLATKQLRWR